MPGDRAWNVCFDEVARRKVNGGPKTTPAEEVTFLGSRVAT